MHVNCADFVYKAMGELIQVLYPSGYSHFIANLIISFSTDWLQSCLIKDLSMV